MSVAADNFAAGFASATLSYTAQSTMAADDARYVADVVAAAVARLSGDLAMYRPAAPAFVYALTAETHAAIVQRWQQHPAALQAALLTGLAETVKNLLQDLRARLARAATHHGFMFGQEEEAMRLETCADALLEELRRIQTDLSAFQTLEILN